MQMKASVIVVTIIVVILLAAACSEDDEPSSSTSSTTTTTPGGCDVEALFVDSCGLAGCHSADEPAAGLDLVSPGVDGRVVEVPAATCARTLVVPGDIDLSFLYEKTAFFEPECGDFMPTGGVELLTPTKRACIQAWIEAMPSGCETCGGAGCVDTSIDVLHCGGCGVACPTDATCSGGSCICDAGGSDCQGVCVDTMANYDHCGGCDMPCGGPLVCSLGACKMGCDGALTACNGGCVDTTSDANHCGGCGIDCGTGVCDQGACNCGVGIDTQTDPNNCGSCGNVCAAGQSCEAGACACGSASVSFSADVQPVFTARCATNGCHKGVKPQEGLNMTAGSAYGALVNVTAAQCNDGRKRVLPGDPGQSYIVNKLLGTGMCFGTKMPKLGAVPEGELAAITNWICGGALDN
jgi:hypothetical protein